MVSEAGVVERGALQLGVPIGIWVVMPTMLTLISRIARFVRFE
jgi:hypothetical protein